MAHLALHFPVTNKKIDSNFLSEFIERKELFVRLVLILLEYCFNYVANTYLYETKVHKTSNWNPCGEK